LEKLCNITKENVLVGEKGAFISTILDKMKQVNKDERISSEQLYQVSY
jgi:hypothetical protein